MLTIKGCTMRSNRKTWLNAGLWGLALGTGLGLTGCQSGKGFLSRNSGPASPPPMWQVKPTDGATAQRKTPSEIASADDGTGNAFSPPGSVQQTSGNKSGSSGVTQAAGRGQSTGFQSAASGGTKGLVPPPTAQGSAYNTASQLPLPKVPGVAPITEGVVPPKEIQTPGSTVSSSKEVGANPGETSPLGAADLVPPPAPSSMVSIPSPPPAAPEAPAAPVPGDLPVPPPPAEAPSPKPVAPPAPVVNPNPPPNVSGPAVSPLPIGGSQLPPPPGSPTMQGSPLRIPAAPYPAPNR